MRIDPTREISQKDGVVGRAQERDKSLQIVLERSQSVPKRSGAAAAADTSSKPLILRDFELSRSDFVPILASF